MDSAHPLKKPSLVLASDVMRINGIDEATMLYSDHFHEFNRILCNPQGQFVAGNETLRPWEYQRIPCDILYLRCDFSHHLLKEDRYLKLIDCLKPSKIVLGYHNHAPHVENLVEKNLFERADKFILCNAAAKSFFAQKYPSSVSKPTTLLRSQYLPNLSWYGEYCKNLRKASEPLRLIIPNNANLAFTSTDPDTGEVVLGPLAHRGRYAFYRILQHLGKDLNTSVTVLGHFRDINDRADKLKSDVIERAYHSLEGNFKFPGWIPNQSDLLKTLKDHHLGLMAAYLPEDAPLLIESMHYQLRYNSLIKSNTPPVVSSNQSTWLEHEIAVSNFGIVLRSSEELHNLSNIVGTIESSERTWKNIAERNSLEYYLSDIVDFLKN